MDVTYILDRWVEIERERSERCGGENPYLADKMAKLGLFT